MLSEFLVTQLKSTQDFILNTVSSFDEADSNYAPEKDMLTVAQHVYSVAQGAEWLIAGAMSPDGFDRDYAGMQERVMKCESLEAAVTKLKGAFKNAIQNIEKKPDDFFLRVLPAPMDADLLNSIIWTFTDHMAHHRGSLAVYARMLGKTPKPCYDGY